ncbi:acetylornithine deacetylase [Prevotella sp. ne3005]|jgi:acetylornithine deacetylase|uniref:M20 family metallo-hydrolase n=1 Tax=Prevotella sp. ne3005 TaxID=1761887 RepID=UPI0008B6C45F|nr:M20 family metallo-hydrolase [Prevotella sp. ne3005]SEM73411.1 acetylornithine deacetylase [Prevotella sp. ne3005]
MNTTDYTNDAVTLLKELIAIPSVSRNEDKAADKLSEYLNLWGLPHGRDGNNLWVGCPDWDNNRPTIMLNAHIDTVKPVSTWTRDPFLPTQEGDMIYGLGSNDCGGGLVSLLQAYRIMLHRPRNYNLLWVASAEEEVSGANGFSRVLSKLPNIAVAIVGEPTGMQPAIAEKGLMVIDGYAYGKSGHAARNEGVNAIYEALDDLVWLRDYKFRKSSPLLGPTKMTVTVVESGTQHNVIPDTLHFVIDVRTNEFYQNEYLFEFLCKKMTKCELKARSFRLHSSSIPQDHPLIRRCMEHGMQPFGSPTLSDQALMPFPSFKLGPGDSSRSHSADEYIKISEIQQAIDTYVSLLDGLTL